MPHRPTVAPLVPLTPMVRQALSVWTDDLLTHELIKRAMERQENQATYDDANELMIGHLNECLYWAQYQRDGTKLPRVGKKK